VEERGLHFLCFNASLSRQFEFVQSNWVQNPAFAGLSSDPDPLLGANRELPFPATDFTIQGCPVRRVRGLPRVVETRGGAYFFMPSRRALAFLSRK
jgi:deferrochelatase/peroxidase EfeB